MGRQFYQYWHSGYNDAQILTNLQSLDQIQPMFPEEEAHYRFNRESTLFAD